MRVATRRLRAALALFAGVLPVRAQVFREELGWLGRLLGRGARPRRATGRAGRRPLTAPPPGGAPVPRPERPRPARRAARPSCTASATRPGPPCSSGLDSVRWERLAKGLAAMVQQGPARRSVATRVPAVIGMPDLVVARHDAVAKAAKRAKRSGVVARLPPPAHPLQAAALRARVQLRGLRRAHRPLRPPAHRRAGRAGAHAGRRGGLAAPGRAGDRRRRLPAATVFVMGGVAERHRRDVERLLAPPAQAARHAVGGREWRDLLDLMERRRRGRGRPAATCGSTLRAVPAPPASPHRTGPHRRRRSDAGPASSLSPVTSAAVTRSHRLRGPRCADHPAAAPGQRPGTAAAVRPSGNEPASSPITTRGCSVRTKCSRSVSRKRSMSAQMSAKSGSSMWAR